MQDDCWLSTAEAAELLDRSIKTVSRWARTGQLPYERKLPGRTGSYLFRRDQVAAVAARLRKAA